MSNHLNNSYIAVISLHKFNDIIWYKFEFSKNFKNSTRNFFHLNNRSIYFNPLFLPRKANNPIFDIFLEKFAIFKNFNSQNNVEKSIFYA